MFYKLYFIFTNYFFCRFDASFGDQTVTIAFKYLGLPDIAPGQIKIVRKTNKMEIFV